MKAISSTGTFLNIEEIPYIKRDNAIKEWQQSMDFAIGHHSEWTSDTKFTYQRGSLQGKANDAFEAFQKHDNFAKWKGEYDTKNGVGNQFQELICLLLGTHGAVFTEEAVAKECDYAEARLNNIILCDICHFKSYANEYEKLYLKLGVVQDHRYLKAFYSKLPPPWNEICERTYQKRGGDPT